MKNHANKSRKSARVLIVDDDRRVLGALSQQLKEIGCSCVTCDNGSEAMLQFASGRVDLVVTDLTMPGVDGFSVINLIRSESAVPIIVVTGHFDDYQEVLGRYENITTLRKPFGPAWFVAQVQSAIATLGVPNARAS
ncbi:MAG TPA: response regulator [Tepidisphaeraceae bacterium]|nr:response regulator [Tepidisphaeraceae bacterium]